MSETPLTPYQIRVGCWVCACDATRMPWDFCGHCGEQVDDRLSPARRALYRSFLAPVTEP